MRDFSHNVETVELHLQADLFFFLCSFSFLFSFGNQKISMTFCVKFQATHAKGYEADEKSRIENPLIKRLFLINTSNSYRNGLINARQPSERETFILHQTTLSAIHFRWSHRLAFCKKNYFEDG